MRLNPTYRLRPTAMAWNNWVELLIWTVTLNTLSASAPTESSGAATSKGAAQLTPQVVLKKASQLSEELVPP